MNNFIPHFTGHVIRLLKHAGIKVKYILKKPQVSVRQNDTIPDIGHHCPCTDDDRLSAGMILIIKSEMFSS